MIAFSDLLVGTSLTNNHQHQSQVELSRDTDDQYLQAIQGGPTQTTVDYGAKEGAVPPHISKKSRKKNLTGTGLARRGVEPKGENLTIWKSKQRMQEMFERGRLCRGTIPPSKLQTETKLRYNYKSQETVGCQGRKLL